jgi:hypothetical protein
LRAAELHDVAAAMAEELWLDAAGDLSQSAPQAFVASEVFGSLEGGPGLSLGGLPSGGSLPSDGSLPLTGTLEILSASAAVPVQP